MSQTTLKSARIDRPSSSGRNVDRASDVATSIRYEDAAIVIAQMTPAERARAYEAGVFTLAELNGAARLRPDLMPIVNGEFEWIALTMADLD